MPNPAPQRLDKMPGACGRERDHVDDAVGPERRDLCAERPRPLLSIAIDRHRLHRRPGAVRLIRLGLPAADIDDVMPRFDQHWNEIRADMPAATDDDYSHF
jgi:hypothetical protein